VVIEGVQSWIMHDADHRIDVIACGADIDQVVAGPGADADVLLVDLNLNGRFVTDKVAELCAQGRRVIVYSQHTDPALVLAVYEAGASEFLAKHEGRDHCVDTILAVASDRPYVTPSAAGALVQDSRPQRPALSEQERTALKLWFQSMSKASVARRMGISERTVRQYIDRARVKYARSGRKAITKTALLARAIEDGIVRPDEIGEYRSFAIHTDPPNGPGEPGSSG